MKDVDSVAGGDSIKAEMSSTPVATSLVPCLLWKSCVCFNELNYLYFRRSIVSGQCHSGRMEKGNRLIYARFSGWDLAVDPRQNWWSATLTLVSSLRFFENVSIFSFDFEIWEIGHVSVCLSHKFRREKWRTPAHRETSFTGWQTGSTNNLFGFG